MKNLSTSQCLQRQQSADHLPVLARRLWKSCNSNGLGSGSFEPTWQPILPGMQCLDMGLIVFRPCTAGHLPVAKMRLWKSCDPEGLGTGPQIHLVANTHWNAVSEVDLSAFCPCLDITSLLGGKFCGNSVICNTWFPGSQTHNQPRCIFQRQDLVFPDPVLQVTSLLGGKQLWSSCTSEGLSSGPSYLLDSKYTSQCSSHKWVLLLSNPGLQLFSVWRGSISVNHMIQIM